MAKDWQVLGEYNAEGTSYSNLAGGLGSSPYTPSQPGRLKGIRLIINRAAATSLINGIVVKLTSATFKPNSLEFAAVGSGLQTAPALSGGMNAITDYEVDQEVQPGVKIAMEGKNVSESDTPVTVSVIVMGLFES